MAYPGVIVEIDEVDSTRWVTHTDGKHYPFEARLGETRFENTDLEEAQRFKFIDDPCGYEVFKAHQQYLEQQQ